MAHNYNSYAISEPSNISWSPELMMSMKHTFDKQYPKDKLVDIMYSEQRRIRRAVPGPQEGYQHPDEINGVRLFRKGKGIPPAASGQEQIDDKELMPRRGRGHVCIPSEEKVIRRQLGSAAPVPEDKREQLWPSRGKRQDVPRPQEQKEQQWHSKGRRLVPGMSNLDHNVQTLLSWNPDASAAEEEEQQQQRQQQPGQLPAPPRPGRRAVPGANLSSIIFG